MTHALLTSLCPVIIWMMLVIFFASVCFAVQDGTVRLRRLHQVPCSRCAFFAGDPQLRCAVHPCKALSEEAIGCLDYEPNTSRQRRWLVFRFGRSGPGKAIWELLTAVNSVQ